jgi:hypothetical protein
MVALAAVVVAAIYSWLTHRIADATRRQAETTHAMFEAGHRPYLLIPASRPEIEAHGLLFDLPLENRGSVPAIVVGFLVTVRNGTHILAKESGEKINQVIFQGGAQRFWRLNLPRSPEINTMLGADEPLELEAIVEYRGIGLGLFKTRVVFELRMSQQRISWGWKESQLDTWTGGTS